MVCLIPASQSHGDLDYDGRLVQSNESFRDQLQAGVFTFGLAFQAGLKRDRFCGKILKVKIFGLILPKKI